ncbi:uncharacterized protein K452DRAFT_341920, partial [Aplosporella prunicola CBS 121167]
LRQALNKAFQFKFPKLKTIIAAAIISPRGNLVLTAFNGLSAKFLVDNKVVINSVLPTTSAFKIAVHGVPTANILNESRESFAELVRDEVKTFNKGLNPVGNPY